jgi:amidohydrolase
MNRTDTILPGLLNQIIELRHNLHAHPELALHEYGTARIVAEHLARLPQLSIQTGIGGTAGIKAIICPDKPAPAVLLRADMDALPIQEQNDLPYRSQVAGCMHACGHDGHTACLVGTAMLLAEMADELPGPVVLIFQPAEESLGGGKILVEAGVLDNPRVGAAFALHGWPMIPVGRIGICRGQAMAATGGFAITVKGRGGHGASPHETADPIVISARIIEGLQQITSRMVSPLQPAVVTVGTIHGGTTLNIIPSQVEMTGTVRALSNEVRAEILRHVEQIATHTAAAFGAQVEVSVSEAYPSVYNDPAACDFVARVAKDTLGPDAVVEHGPTMAGEDFAYYLERVPGAILRLGMDGPGRPSAMLHQPHYNFNDDALSTGIRILSQIALRWPRSER